MAITNVATFQAVNQALTQLDNKLNLILNQPQDIHGRRITGASKSQKPTDYVTRQELSAFQVKAVIPGTQIPLEDAGDVRTDKQNIFTVLQRFLGGLESTFISLKPNVALPKIISGDWSFYYVRNAAIPANPSGLFLKDNGNIMAQPARIVLQIDHETYRTAIQQVTYWSDTFLPGADSMFDLGRNLGYAVGTPSGRWQGIYGLYGRFEGMSAFPAIGRPITSDTAGIGISQDTIRASTAVTDTDAPIKVQASTSNFTLSSTNTVNTKLATDGTIPVIGGGGGWVYGEVPSGTINGTNQNFTLANTPSIVTSIHFYWNGLLLKRGTDYSVTGSTIVMITPPNPGDILLVDYQSAAVTTGTITVTRGWITGYTP